MTKTQWRPLRERGTRLALLVALAAAPACSGNDDSGAPAESTGEASPTESAAPPPTSSADDAAELLRAVMDLPVDADLIPGAIVLLRVNDDVVVLTAGKAQLRPKRAMRPGLRFPVASLTKPMVAALALQLVEDGTLSLADTVEEWVPGLLPAGSSITVGQLLSHRSGLPNYFEIAGMDVKPGRGPIPAASLVPLVADRPLQFEPGSATEYSNTGYLVLGLVVEAATRQPLAEALQDRVFAPLQMTETSLGRGGPPDQRDVHGYAKDRDASRTAVTEAGLADSGVVSTVGDVNRFWQGLLAGELVSGESLDQMTTVTGSVDWADYGFGVAIQQTSCGTAYGHTGSILGYQVSAWALADADRAVVAMANRNDDGYSVDFTETFAETALCVA